MGMALDVTARVGFALVMALDVTARVGFVMVMSLGVTARVALVLQNVLSLRTGILVEKKFIIKRLAYVF